MLNVTAAFSAVMSTVRDFGTERVPFDTAVGRVLRETIYADRSFPPFDRVMMDGIAISYDSYAKGQLIFGVEDIQAAGMPRKQLGNTANCMEVMTGAVLPELTDTVIPYEHLHEDEHAGFRRFTIEKEVRQGQNIHLLGSDAPAGKALIAAGTLIGAAEVAVLATVGHAQVTVSKLPKVVVIATGDELVPVTTVPEAHQIRVSNLYSIGAALHGLGITAQYLHLEDSEAVMEAHLRGLLQDTDVWICSGAVSAGKYDHLPQVLQQLGMQQVFHKVQQRPGKPFLFGVFENGPVVFALPGNPVSGFMCYYRYVQPWLQAGMLQNAMPLQYAVLGEDILFDKPLEYYLPVKLHPLPSGQWEAIPQTYHGSGDLAGLLLADAFMALPAEQDVFKKGSSFPVWRFR